MKTKRIKPLKAIASCAFLIAIFSSQISIAQDDPIKDAYRQLRLLSSEREAGINYLSFSEQWGKSLGLINIAIEDSKPSPHTKQLNLIKITYGDIKELWNCNIQFSKSASSILACLSSDFEGRNKGIIEKLQNRANSSSNYNDNFYQPGNIEGAEGVIMLFDIGSTQIKELGLMLKGKEKKK